MLPKISIISFKKPRTHFTFLLPIVLPIPSEKETMHRLHTPISLPPSTTLSNLPTDCPIYQNYCINSIFQILINCLFKDDPLTIIKLWNFLTNTGLRFDRKLLKFGSQKKKIHILASNSLYIFQQFPQSRQENIKFIIPFYSQ